MPKQVVMGAMLQCSFGAAPSTLSVIPAGRPLVENMPAANISDFAPMVNIMPFGVCIAPTNPAFIAATTAALGVPTPVPCMPIVTTPWIPGSTGALVANLPALNNTCQNLCLWAGVIMITNPGALVTDIP